MSAHGRNGCESGWASQLGARVTSAPAVAVAANSSEAARTRARAVMRAWRIKVVSWDLTTPPRMRTRRVARGWSLVEFGESAQPGLPAQAVPQERRTARPRGAPTGRWAFWR